MTPEEKIELRRQYPNHFFCKVITGGYECIVAIPKEHADKPLKSCPPVTVDMLHGATAIVTPRKVSISKPSPG